MNLQQLQQQRQDDVLPETKKQYLLAIHDGDSVTSVWNKTLLPLVEKDLAASVLAGYLLALEEMEKGFSDVRAKMKTTHDEYEHSGVFNAGVLTAIDIMKKRLAPFKAQAEALTGKE